MRQERGLTIIEAMIAGFVLLIGAMGMVSVISDVLVLTTSTNDTTVAVQAARSRMDELWSQSANDFTTLYVRYNSDISDDPPDNNSPGDKFDVPGLDPINPGDRVGQITFFVDESIAAIQLGLVNNEGDNDPDGPISPGAIDIDRNGEFNEAGVKVTDPWSPNPPSHQILPVRIEIKWRDPTAKSGGAPLERGYKIESIIYPR